MSTSSRIARILTAAASLAACGGGDGGVAPDPCTTPGACEVAGIDLALDAFTLDAVNVPELQIQAVPVGGTVNVAFTVRSRGSQTAPASALTVCVGPGCAVTRTASIPALAPGRTHSGSVALPSLAQAGEVSVAGTLTGADAEAGNNARSLPLLVERPDLRATVRMVEDQQDWPVGYDARAVVTVRNHAHVAGAPASTARVCLFAFAYNGCAGGARTPAIPALAAGAAHEEMFVFALPFSILRWADRRETLPVTACVDPEQRIDQVRDELDCGSRLMDVLTNLDAMCSPPLLTPGTPVSGVLQTSDCDLSFARDVDLVKLDVQANSAYTLTLTAFPSGQQVDGEHEAVEPDVRGPAQQRPVLARLQLADRGWQRPPRVRAGGDILSGSPQRLRNRGPAVHAHAHGALRDRVSRSGRGGRGELQGVLRALRVSA